jgi:formylglycine-generating enzyme required for sulfatase activity
VQAGLALDTSFTMRRLRKNVPTDIWRSLLCASASYAKVRFDRGGAWNFPPDNLRSAFRDTSATGYRIDNPGFRVGRTLIHTVHTSQQ